MPSGMANILKPELQHQISTLGRLGWSLRDIEARTGVRRETVGRYLRRLGIALRAPRGRVLGVPKAASQVTAGLLGSGGPEEPASLAAPALSGPIVAPTLGSPDLGLGQRESADAEASLWRPSTPAGLTRGRGGTPSACADYRQAIEAGLARGQNATAIFQDLVDRHGFKGSYSSVKRFVRRVEPKCEWAHPRIETPPGEEAQVDYGEGPLVRDLKTGKYRRPRLFALTLGYSRKAVWLLTWASSSENWCRLHEEAFRRLGGVPSLIVLDNLKEGVLKADYYDPVLNPLYRDMLKHYGVEALPARVYDPDRKGKVERSVGYAQSTAFKGRRFESIEAAQAYLDHWTENWADERIHGTTKRQVRQAFEEERPHLKPLPIEPFRYYKHGTRVVHMDGHIEVEGAYYGAPIGMLGKKVKVQWDSRNVRILDITSGILLREHIKQRRGYRTIAEEDRPVTTPRSTLALLDRADRAGPWIGALCREMHTRRKEASVRRILGVLSFTKSNGVEAVNEAARIALELGVPDYRFIKQWLLRHPQPTIVLRQSDELIRSLSEYRDILVQREQQMSL
jgi:transposase